MNTILYTCFAALMVLMADHAFVRATRIACDPLRAFAVSVLMPARMLVFLAGYLIHCAEEGKLPRRLLAKQFWYLPWALFWAAWDGFFVGMPVEKRS